MSGCSGRILLYDFGELTQLTDRIEQFRHLVRKYEEQSGESVTDNVRQAVFQAGIKDAAIRDHLALHAGRLNSFDKMATEVSTVSRSRSENDVVHMDVSVLKGKGGKGKNGKGKDGKNKEGKVKTKDKDDRDKSDPKSNCVLCTRGLNDPLPLSQIVQTQLLNDFRRRHRTKQLLLLGRKPITTASHISSSFSILMSSSFVSPILSGSSLSTV